MEIKKKADSFNTYSVTLSFGELQAVFQALAKHHADPIADEMFMGIKYYMERIPGPGEDDKDKDEEGDENSVNMDNVDNIDLDSVLPSLKDQDEEDTSGEDEVPTEPEE